MYIYSDLGRFSYPTASAGPIVMELFMKEITRFDDGTVEEMEQTLLAQMLNDMNKTVPVSKIKLSEPGAKWRVISAMQKAIRRGDTETAVKCALAVDAFDSKYLWRRLAVVGFEDGGISMLPLTALICFIAGKLKFRESLDDSQGRRVLAYIVEQMARSAKDRSLCETANAGHFLVPSEERDWLYDYSVDREFVLQRYRDLGEPIEKRFISGLALAGGMWRQVKDLEGKEVPEYAPSDRKMMLSWVDSQPFPLMVKYCVRRGLGLGAEGLPVALPIIWPKFLEDTKQTAEPIFFEKGECPEPIFIGKLPSYAFDGHNLEGKKSIAYFVKSCDEVRDWLDNNFKGDKQRIVKSAIFWCEGGLALDRYLWYPTWAHVFRLAYTGEAAFYGQSWGKLFEFYNLVKANLPVLNKVRRLIVEGLKG